MLLPLVLTLGVLIDQLPLLPSGSAMQVELGDFEAAGTGGSLWHAAKVLCSWQARSADSIRGSRVLELGCGTGGCGLYAAGLGAKSVLLTDALPGCLELVRRNIRLNQEVIHEGCDVSVLPLLWGSELRGPTVGPFDLVLGSVTLAPTYPPTQPKQEPVTDWPHPRPEV